MQLKYWGILALFEKLKQKTEAHAISLNSYMYCTISSSSKHRFIVCPSVDLSTKKRTEVLPLQTEVPIYGCQTLRKTFLFEYLPEFETEYKNILGYESGAHMGSIQEKEQVENLVILYLKENV
jgi:hypothetical protein